VMAALAEANCDERGLSWPAQIAPFDVHVLATGKGDEVFATAASLGDELDAAGLDVLVDDRRKVSAGVKFKDFELVGIPFGLVVGRSLADGKVEIRVRATGETNVVPVEEAAARLRELHGAAVKGE
ncbi:MAG: His/Gly/Thr/Pro-type tRNA ligase C-terminal domain-containing protein, partial [Pauljensenia sp.]